MEGGDLDFKASLLLLAFPKSPTFKVRPHLMNVNADSMHEL